MAVQRFHVGLRTVVQFESAISVQAYDARHGSFVQPQDPDGFIRISAPRYQDVQVPGRIECTVARLPVACTAAVKHRDSRSLCGSFGFNIQCDVVKKILVI